MLRLIVVMTDPAVHVEDGYDAYERGSEAGVWVKMPDGSDMLGVVWPGEPHSLLIVISPY